MDIDEKEQKPSSSVWDIIKNNEELMAYILNELQDKKNSIDEKEWQRELKIAETVVQTLNNLK